MGGRGGGWGFRLVWGVVCLTRWSAAVGCWVLTHTHMHTCTHAHMHTCTHAHMHTCTHAHMHTCTHAHMHALRRRLYIRAGIHSVSKCQHAHAILPLLPLLNRITVFLHDHAPLQRARASLVAIPVSAIPLPPSPKFASRGQVRDGFTREGRGGGWSVCRRRATSSGGGWG